VPPLPTYSSSGTRLALVAAAALACTLSASPIFGAAEAELSPKTPQRERLTIAPEEVMTPWTGDLDGMIARRVIRVLTVYSKTFYFMDKGIQRGTTYDIFQLFETDLNKKLANSKQLKRKHIKVRVVFIPVHRGDLLQALAAGKGDIAASNLTVSEERERLVDFSSPVYRNVTELVVSGPASPAVSSVDDLAGKEVFVRTSSSYYESLLALNQRFATEKKPPVIIKEAPEELEDEDLIEMVNAGLIPLIVVDKHKADFWKRIFPKITVHDGVAVRSGGDIAWAIRKESPQLKAALDDFTTRSGRTTEFSTSRITATSTMWTGC
jgi:membrane-bound lytic murein transglycosylase MltF